MRRIGGAEQKGKRERAIRFAVFEDADNNRPRDYPELLEALQNLTNEINHIGININQIVKNNNSGLYHESDKKRLYVYMKQIKEAVMQVVSHLDIAGN